MSDWKIVVPEETENFVQNPSAETTGNFAAVGGGVITRVTTESKYGLYSYNLVFGANNRGATFTLEALTNNIHYVTMRVAGTLPPAWDWSLDNIAYTAPTLIETIDEAWTLYGLQFPAAEANGSTLLYVRQDGAGGGTIQIDGIQCEQKTYWTTYTDGTQVGCEWEGAEDGSTSRRSALTRGGGRVRDLEDDYFFQVSDAIGAGMSPQIDNLDSYAIIPGAALNSIKVTARPFTLIGTLTGTTSGNLRDRMQDLINLVSDDQFPEDEDGIQPVRIRYTGATVQKEILVHYEAGLEGRQTWRDPECWERIAGLRFISPNPDWLEIGETATLLVPLELSGDTFRHIAVRSRQVVQALFGASTPWDNLSVGANPAAGTVLTIVTGPDKRIYIGGSFTDWDGVAGSDFVAVYNPLTDTWATLGGAADFNGTVYALAFGPDGTLYAGGAFTNVAGDANADYVAQWDGANWSAVAGGGTADVRALAFGIDGLLYIGGTFTNWNGIGAADFVVSWDGAAYAALSTGTPSACHTLALHPNGNIYAGGGVLAASGYVQYWNGTAWTDITASSLSEDITYTLAINSAGQIYAGGAWPTSIGTPLTPYHIGRFNGSTWDDVGGGLFDNPVIGNENAGDVRKIVLAPDGRIWAGGDFRYFGGDRTDIDNGLAVFYGNNWSMPGFDLGVNVVFNAVEISNQDPVIDRSYDVYVGFNASVVFPIISANATVTNAGSAEAFPKIVMLNEIGSTIFPWHVLNESVGDVLLYNYGILDGDTLTVDLEQAKKEASSDFFGRVSALQPDSNTGTWSLPANLSSLINVFMRAAGVANITIYVIYRTPYTSYD
jgi:hypothetical protein